MHHRNVLRMLSSTWPVALLSLQCWQPLVCAAPPHAGEQWLCAPGCLCSQDGLSAHCEGVTPRTASLPASLVSLTARAHQLRHISNDTFLPLPGLQQLDLSDGRISEVEDDAFSALPGLRSLSLSNNELSFLPASAFLANEALEALDLSRNPLVLPSIGPFLRSPSLRELSLADCSLRRFTPDALTQLPSLLSLDLSSNAFLQLTSQSVHSFGNLSWLRVDADALSEEALAFLQDNGVEVDDFGSFPRLPRFALVILRYIFLLFCSRSIAAYRSYCRSEHHCYRRRCSSERRIRRHCSSKCRRCSKRRRCSECRRPLGETAACPVARASSARPLGWSRTSDRDRSLDVARRPPAPLSRGRAASAAAEGPLGPLTSPPVAASHRPVPPSWGSLPAVDPAASVRPPAPPPQPSPRAAPLGRRPRGCCSPSCVVHRLSSVCDLSGLSGLGIPIRRGRRWRGLCDPEEHRCRPCSRKPAARRGFTDRCLAVGGGDSLDCAFRQVASLPAYRELQRPSTKLANSKGYSRLHDEEDAPASLPPRADSCTCLSCSEPVPTQPCIRFYERPASVHGAVPSRFYSL